MKPVIAITCDRNEVRSDGPPRVVDGRTRPRRNAVVVAESVVDAVRGAGAEVLLVAPQRGVDDAWLDWLTHHIDGLVLTGGAVDLHPSLYGQDVLGRLDRVEPGRAALELGLAKRALGQDLPLLGVCGGMQTLAVAAGGTLIQDIATQIPGAGAHEQPTDPATPWHEVHLESGTLLGAIGPVVAVNSTHHQSVDDPGSLAVVGRSPDGVVEAIEADGHRFCVGVQWHPELMDIAPYRVLVEACRR